MLVSKAIINRPVATFGGTNDACTLLSPSLVDARPDGLAFFIFDELRLLAKQIILTYGRKHQNDRQTDKAFD